MGRRNKKYSKDLHQQAYDVLVSMQSFGESKKQAMADGTADYKIFSYNQWKTYWQQTRQFIRYVNKMHPDCTTLKKARKYVGEWLTDRENQELSAWTIHTGAKALGKLFHIKPGDPDYYTPPKRNRSDIKRSRGDCKRDAHFSKANNDELIKFCRGTGLRRRELEALKGKDLLRHQQVLQRVEELGMLPEDVRTRDEEKELIAMKDALVFSESEFFLFVRNGKGGRFRISPIIGKNVPEIVERIRSTGMEEKVWKYVNSNADIHSYRGDYATLMYRTYARDIEEIPYDCVNKGTGKRYQSGVYSCRKDEKGKKLDKKAMLYCTKALGHNRISIVADNYIRGL